MNTIGDEKLQQIIDCIFYESPEVAVEKFGVTLETLNRYKRLYRKRSPERFKQLETMSKIHGTFSDDDIKNILKSGKHGKKDEIIFKKTFSGDKLKFGVISDTHFGSKYFDKGIYLSAIQEIKKQDCQFICHIGDVTDGMSNRPDHIYQLTHIGYDAQKEYALELLNEWDKKWYIVDGNHDSWFTMRSGSYIVKDICKELDDADYVGQNQGDIVINDIKIRLFHGLDGSSYATSYRIQKVIESFTGGGKPNLLLLGHTHKALYLFERNVHAISAGALSLQSSWMRGKKLSNHTGFWICELQVDNGEILGCKTEFFPFYD